MPMTMTSKAQFRRRSFHEPNQIPPIKHMNSSASESTKNGYLNSERLGRSFLLVRLANGFDSSVELFMSRTETFSKLTFLNFFCIFLVTLLAALP